MFLNVFQCHHMFYRDNLALKHHSEYPVKHPFLPYRYEFNFWHYLQHLL